jgi:hypothetical protein
VAEFKPQCHPLPQKVKKPLQDDEEEAEREERTLLTILNSEAPHFQ